MKCILYKDNNNSSQNLIQKLCTKTEIFTEDSVFHVPEGVTLLKVMCYGAGGGGGFGASGYSGGGGGGGYWKEAWIEVTPKEVIYITIGLGGYYTRNGGATFFGTYLSADGGETGKSYAQYSCGGSGGSGGGGGTSNHTNKVNATGGIGYQFGGGGGGSAIYSTTGSAQGGAGGQFGGNGGQGSAKNGITQSATKGQDGIDTTLLEVPFPGPAPAGELDPEYPNASTGGTGGGGYGAKGGDISNTYGTGGDTGGTGGGGYGGPGGDVCKSDNNDPGGGGGGGYGPAGKGGSVYPYINFVYYNPHPYAGGIGAGGAGSSSAFTASSPTINRGGNGICTVTYTIGE